MPLTVTNYRGHPSNSLACWRNSSQSMCTIYLTQILWLYLGPYQCNSWGI